MRGIKIKVSLFIFLSLIILLSTKKEKSENNNPVIYRVIPDKAFVGDEITIYGKNFGNDRNDGKVFFGSVGCQDYDFDYINWQDDMIKVKVPTGAGSSDISIMIDGYVINGPFFESYSEGSFVYSDPMETTIDYTLLVKSTNGTINKSLYVWVPSSVPSDKQRDVKLIKTSGNHIQRQNDELDLYLVNGLVSGKEYTVEKTFTFNNYQLETKIDPEKVTGDYDKESQFYKYYTSSAYAVESDDPRMVSLANSIVRDEINPYKKAKLIYDWIIDFMEYQYPPPRRDWRAISALRTRRGDCAVYSFLFTALCRVVGVPARPVAGHVIFMNDIVSLHFWAEFYLPKYGWIPVDVNYGDVQVEGFKPKAFYFGNMDNRHIAFSKGRVLFYLPENGNTKGKDLSLRFLQKYHSYMPEKPSNANYQVKRIIRRVK